MKIKLGQKIFDILYGKIARLVYEQQQKIDYIYQKGGILPLSSEFKRRTIKEYSNFYGCKTFVETGTYLGDTTDALKDNFNEIYTIELSQELYEKAQKRFENNPKIHCYQGNSKDVLPTILNKIDTNPIFWLDAHYSAGITAKADKETPIEEELEIILNRFNKMVILIDDAREFGTVQDYPSIFTVKTYVKKKFPKAEFELYNDIIRIIIGHN